MRVLDIPWIEKYRPKTLSDIMGQKQIVERLSAFVEAKSFPNMIFAGTAGIGKTTSAIAFANDLYGEDLHGAFKELNASVTPDTPVLIRTNNTIERTTIGDVASRYFLTENDKYTYPTDLEVLTIDKSDFKIKFMPVKNISRHFASKIQEINFEGGSVDTTADHSVIIINREGELESIRAEGLKVGDFLITFNTSMESNQTNLDLTKYAPSTFITWGPATNRRVIKNPKVYNVLSSTEVEENLAWFFGSYLAEGAIGFRDGTSGISVLTYAYPQENEYVNRSADVVSKLGFGSNAHTIVSGTSGRESGIQLTISSTQLARFFKYNFYNKNALKHVACEKRIPNFVFNLPEELRHKFLQGYAGDATGEWGELLRYSSVSKELLIDMVWLARISCLESSYFKTEARIVWKRESYSYIRNELVPVLPFINFMKSLTEAAKFNWRYNLRHSLYYKRSDRARKSLLNDTLNKINIEKLTDSQKTRFYKLKKILDSQISATEIKSINPKQHNGYVYDFSVPGSEMFWGGTIPVLLHNSDERGIDVIRGAVKEFAKTISVSHVTTKIIFLDEADSLTADAQHALRRTMEKFSAETRFILSANYASKIIDPIQSRCVVFRFRSLNEEDVKLYIKRIVTSEELEIDEKAINALIYVAEGDLRKLTNILQSSAIKDKKITDTSIYEVAAKARPDEIASMLKCAVSGDFNGARNELYNLILKQGMSAEDILTQCFREVQNLNVEEKIKLRIMSDIGESNFRIVEGANERIQLEALMARIALEAKPKK